MVFAVFLVVFFVLCVIIRLINRNLRLPPGPRGLPFIGNAHQVSACPFTSHSAIADKYGDIHSVSLFGRPVVVLSSLAAIEQISAASQDNFSHRPVWLSCFFNLAPGLVMKGATEYQVPRRFMLTNLKRMGMGKLGLEPQILEEAEMLMEHLEAEGVVNPSTTLANFTSNNIMRMMFHQRWKYGDPANKVFIKAINTISTKMPIVMLEDFVGMFKHLPLVKRAKKETKEGLSHLRNLFRENIEKRIAEQGSVENDDFTNSYLQAHETMDKEEISTLVDLCQDAFVGGTETTSATLNFVIVHLLNNPSWQEELFQEISTSLQGGVPSMDDLEKLPKLAATIQETLRLNPNVPMLFKATAQATQVRDYVVPANCLVMVNAFHINYDPLTFPNPAVFSPQRWLHPDGSFRRDLMSAVVSFGSGRRNCVGQPLARMELVLLLATLIKRFVLSVPKGCAMPSGKLSGDAILVQPEQYSLALSRRTQV